MADEMTAEQTPPPAPDGNGAALPDDFDKALAEFDQGSAAPGKASHAAERDAAAFAEATKPRITQEQIANARELGELRLWAMDVQQERLVRRENEDLQAVFAQAREHLADFDNLPPDYAERWLRAEHAIDAELHDAWNNRYESAEAMARCKSCLRRALGRLREAARQVPDAEATATRSAIAAAVLRSSGPRPPSGPPAYSHLTDGEFRETVKKEYGYTPHT